MIEKVAWFGLTLSLVVNLFTPFLIGKPRTTYSPLNITIGWLLFGGISLPVYGRVIGWW